MVADDHIPYVTPSVRKRAAELEVDVATLTGTGVGGRIRVMDVEVAAARRESSFVLPESDRVLSYAPFHAQVTETLIEEEVAEHQRHPADVVIGKDVNIYEDVHLSYADRNLGVAIIGKSGTGKSSLLEHMILTDLEQGTPGMVIDPHGLLVQRVMQLATPEQADRIILLEALQTAPFGLNLLAVREPTDDDDDPVMWAADSVVATVKKLYGEEDEYLPRLERYLDLAAYTLIPNGRTLVDAPRLFRNDEFRRQCLRRVTDPGILEEWSDYDSLRNIDQMTHTEAVVNRLNRMLRPPLIQGIIGSQETTVPFDQILNGDSMLLVSLPSERLTPERCDFIGALLLCALADRIFVRKVSVAKPPRLHLYLDEYQRFATVTTAELLEQGRKYGAGVTLAHQTLYQIPEQRIRNAARHAGSLIVLGVTRPDADELAGEFPINPREEWVETIEEIDGTEPVYVLSPTPAEDIYVEPHADPEVDLAARSLLTAYFRSTSTTEKSAGVPPRPGGLKVDDRVKLHATEVQPFLSRAMAGELSTNELFADALIESQRPVAGHYPRALYFLFYNQSPSHLDVPVHHTYCQPTRRECRCAMDRPFKERAHNDKVRQVYESCVSDQLERIRTWILSYLEDQDALRAGEQITAFVEADVSLSSESDSSYWDGIWNWANPLQKSPTGELEPAERPPFFMLTPPEHWKVIHERAKARNEARDILRQRLRWLVILAKGLERSPLWVTNGQQQPRRTKRHIVHGGQTHADALAELAGRLVHPPQRYVAHVRQPQQYHQVKLRPPLEGEDGAGGPGTNPTQPDDIRTRSRALYDTSAGENTVIPLPQPEQPEPRRVTRRPRPQDPEEKR